MLELAPLNRVQRLEDRFFDTADPWSANGLVRILQRQQGEVHKTARAAGGRRGCSLCLLDPPGSSTASKHAIKAESSEELDLTFR